jgi:hypothetical protein
MTTTADTWACPTCGIANALTKARCADCGARRVHQGAVLTPQATQPSHPAPRTSRSPRRPTGSRATDATRYLCAAVQQDSGLAARAIESVLEETHRGVASSPGIDLACVLRYALAARRRQTTAQVLLVLTVLCMLLALVMLPVLLAPIALVAWAIVAGDELSTYYLVLKPRLSKGSFDPDNAPRFGPDREQLLKDLAAQDHQGNVVVFSGYEPFIGYGNRLDSWNLALPTDRPGEGFDRVLPFTVTELTERLAESVKALGVPGVEVSERLFVHGGDLRPEVNPLADRLLPDAYGRPVTTLPPAELARLRTDSSGRVRPYLVMTVSGWDGEVVLTTTLRLAFSPARDLLFVEGGTSLLPPVHHAYHRVDYLLDQPTARQLFSLIGTSLTHTPGALVGAVSAVVSGLVALLTGDRKDRAQRREIAQHSFNYGAVLSLRESAGDPKFHRYFQNMDTQMFSKTVQRRIMDRLADFLEAHQVDVSDLRESQNVIYNGGIFTSGNAKVSFTDSAVSAGAGGRLRAAFGGGSEHS